MQIDARLLTAAERMPYAPLFVTVNPSFVLGEFERLKNMLLEAKSNSPLPEEESAFEALDDLLRCLKLQEVST